MLPHSSIAARERPGRIENMQHMKADMGPLLQIKRDVSAFYHSLANKRQQVRAESGGQDRKSQPPQNQNNVSLTWLAVYNPSVQELRIHLKAHVVVMERLLGSNPDLVSAYHLCEKYLKTIMEAFEAEKANQQHQVQHAANDPTVTAYQSSASSSGQDVDLHGMPISMGPRPPVRARSPSVEEVESPAKKAKIKSRLVLQGQRSCKSECIVERSMGCLVHDGQKGENAQ